MVYLIYRKRDDEAASKDYDFSRLNMIEHWKSGEQDVYVSMRHEEWQRGPQDGETMVTLGPDAGCIQIAAASAAFADVRTGADDG